MLIRHTITRLATLGLMLAASATLHAVPQKVAAPRPEFHPADFVYLDGNLVQWRAQSAGRKQSLLTAGPWLIGARNKDKPRDGRLNLYIVAPGTQRHSDEAPQFDHNLVINALPKDTAVAAEWDVYLAIVLDPSLQADLQTERELILARQQSFEPAEDFKFDDIPGSAFLKQFLKFQSIADLEGFRRSDGTLPRLVLVPVGAMVRATASPIEPTTEQANTVATKSDSSDAKDTKESKPETSPVKTEHSSGSASPPQ
jgi:hypothetical protein